MTPDDIKAARFASVRKGGYEVREVDQFLADAMQALESGDGTMTAADVHNARFTLVKRGGYDTQQVDAFLDDLMEALERNPAPMATTGVEPTGVEPTGDVRVLTPPGAQPAPQPPPTVEASGPAISAAQLKNLTPPMIDGLAYDIREVDALLAKVAETLDLFEKVEGEDLQRLRATQYLQGSDGAPLLLVGDQVRAALFTVHDVGGYEPRGVDAAVRRLATVLDYHWNRTA